MLRCSRNRRWISEYVPKGWQKIHGPAELRVKSNFRSIEAAVARADKEVETRGFFSLPSLDYDVSAGVPPLCTRQQFDVQYQLFHRDAVARLNTHTIGSELEGHNLDVVLRDTAFDAARAVIHCAAAEHFNYCFWYKSLRPWGTSVPSRLRNALQLHLSREGLSSFNFSDPVEEVKRRVIVTALSQQECCGWIYLVWSGKYFEVLHFQHGLCPISSDVIPLFTLNIHESAFCFDYERSTTGLQNYISNFFKTCNWILADRNYGATLERE